jgi:hypothetical protein
VLSEENKAKAERVRLELERIRLKASLLDIIESLGEVSNFEQINLSMDRGCVYTGYVMTNSYKF